MTTLIVLMPLLAVIFLNIFSNKMSKEISFYAALFLTIAQVSFAVIIPADYWTLQICRFCNMLFCLPLNFSVDSLTLVMILCIGIVGFSSVVIGWNSISDLNKKFDFVNLLLLSIAGMNGIVMVRDMFSLYVFLEIAAVTSFILIALHKDKDALEGTFKYIIMSAIATVMMLSSIALLTITCGSTSFSEVSNILKIGPQNIITNFALCLFICGLLIKGGVVPFHGWLPDAYSSAPAGVSVLLAGIVTKTTGIYTLIRIVTSVFGFSPSIQNLLLIFGTISIFAGALAALGQKDFKRMLAYSSISQVGYIIVSLGTGTPLGIAGAVFHLFNHSIFKTQLFVNAAAVEEQVRTRDMDQMGGLAYKMPVTGCTSVIALLSTAGIPPLTGFWSKLIIIIALWQSGYYIYAVLAILGSVITLAYMLSMQRRVFFGKLAESFKNVKEANLAMIIPAIFLAVLNIGMGIFFPYILNTFILPVKKIFG